MSTKILLVDDEVDVVNFLSHFLSRMKISSTPVTSGEDALEVFEKGKFDLVFLDIKMRGIDGFIVLEKLKAKDPEVKVIMITGRDDIESQTRAKTLGAIDYIVKPLDLVDLKNKINKYLSSKK